MIFDSSVSNAIHTSLSINAGTSEGNENVVDVCNDLLARIKVISILGSSNQIIFSVNHLRSET